MVFACKRETIDDHLEKPLSLLSTLLYRDCLICIGLNNKKFIFTKI